MSSNYPTNAPLALGKSRSKQLDFVVDPRNQKLIGNPEHNGEHMIDML